MKGPNADPAWLLEGITQAVTRLSASAEEQLAYVEALGSPGLADELAQELDDVLEAAVAVPGLLGPREVASLRVLDEHLKLMSGPDKIGLWTEEAVRTSPEWIEVRHRAQRAFDELSRGS